ncbi:hypothetical protein [Bacillus cereus]|uniref:hypothetical protein n=1 Tax=Bacillus cereus TaxID=1396 RepID=UPI00159703BA|nr:hypothetical protein [Bacillus cereus]MDR4984001.1 hypothetical protein [Bacillus cereus]
MPKKITKTVNKHDKINGSGKKRCTKATQPFVNERNKIDQPNRKSCLSTQYAILHMKMN